jgi:hypothetical protein
MILAAYGLMRLAGDRVVVTAAILLVTVALMSRGVVKWYGAQPNQDYRAAMADLAPRLRAGDAVVFSPDEVRLPSEFYLRSRTDLHVLVPVFPSQGWGKFKTGDEHVDPVDQHTIDRILERHYSRLWVVSYASPGVIVPKVNELRTAYRVVSDREYVGIVEVTLLELR